MNLNTIESNVDYISKRVPQIINNVRAALETKKSTLLKMLKDTNTDYEKFLNFKQEIIRTFKQGDNFSSNYWKTNRDIHNYRYLITPLKMLACASAKDYNEIIETYYSFERGGDNNIERNKLEIWKIEKNHYDDPFQKAFDTKSPTLITIDVCNMSTSCDKFFVPRIMIKSLMRDDIANFMNSNKVSSIVDGCCIGVLKDWKNPTVNYEDELDNRKGYSEVLIGQISINDLFQGILDCYYNAFMRTIICMENLKTPETQDRDEVKRKAIDFIRKYQTIFDIPDCIFLEDKSDDKIDEKEFKEKIVKSMWAWTKELSQNYLHDFISIYQTLDNLNPYAIYLFMESLLNRKTQIEELDDFGSNFKNKLEQNLDEEIEGYITRSVVSMIFTYGAKCGLENYINPLEINQEFVKSLMNETFEDVAALNEGLKTEFNESNIPMEGPDSSLSRRKIANLTRKRLFDYLMISFVANNSGKKNYNLTNYFKNKQSVIFPKYDDSKSYNGSNFYNFIHSCLQEIYAHQTIVSNFQTNIIGFKNNNYVYKDTYELGSQFIKKYINDLKVKENVKEAMLILTKDQYDASEPSFNLDKLLKETCLIDPNSYTFNTMKNHRAFASLLKQLLKYILKLYYITGTYQEICKKEVLLKVPDYIRKIYVKTIEEINLLCQKINRFTYNCNQFLNEIDNNIFHLNIWQGNEWKTISIVEKSDWNSASDYMTKYEHILIQQRIANYWWDLYKKQSTYNRNIYVKRLYELCSINYSNKIEDLATTSEFFLDNDLSRYISNFSEKNNLSNSDPELFAINPSLVASREDINSIEEDMLEKNSYQFDYKKIVDNFKNYIDNKKPNELSIEELFTFSLLASSCEKTLNRQIASMESIQEFNKNNNEFEYLWIKSIDRYRLN